MTIINTSKVTTEPAAEGGGWSGNGSTAGAVGEGQRDLLRSRKSARNYSRSIKSINKQRTNSGDRERRGDSSRGSKTATATRTLGECGRGRAVPRGRTLQIESQKFVYSSKHTQIKEQRQLDKDRNTSNDSNRRHVSKSKGEGAGEIINGV